MDGADLYEQEVRLMAYLLSGFSDEEQSIRDSALVHVERLGVIYVELNETDYKEKMEYGHVDEAAADAALTVPLPSPFVGRPSMGARGRVRQHFRALIHPIMAELQSWTAKERVQSARLLEVRRLAVSHLSLNCFVCSARWCRM